MLQSKTNSNILYTLSIFHIITIAASNYLVQIPFQFMGMNTTWGAFTFPFIFLATDLTVRVYGSSDARRIIFTVMFPALCAICGWTVSGLSQPD